MHCLCNGCRDNTPQSQYTQESHHRARVPPQGQYTQESHHRARVPPQGQYTQESHHRASTHRSPTTGTGPVHTGVPPQGQYTQESHHRASTHRSPTTGPESHHRASTHRSPTTGPVHTGVPPQYTVHRAWQPYQLSCIRRYLPMEVATRALQQYLQGRHRHAYRAGDPTCTLSMHVSIFYVYKFFQLFLFLSHIFDEHFCPFQGHDKYSCSRIASWVLRENRIVHNT